MPARTRTKPEPKTFEVGGLEVTREQVQEAIQVLTNSKGIMIKNFLVKANNPLAFADYHATAEQERIDSLDNLLKTKQAFIKALERLTAE